MIPDTSIHLVNSFPKLNIRMYDVKPNYTIKDLEEEINYSYSYLKDGVDMFPSIIIFHDADYMFQDITFDQIYEEYIYQNIGIMEMLNIYVCCTIRK